MKFSKYIDHTNLVATAAVNDIDKLISEAIEYDFATVCVNPVWVKHAASKLSGSGVEVCTVVGFPLGASVSAVKAFEVARAIEDGADEIDMVINIGALKNGDDDVVCNDIKAVVQAAQGKVVKVIIEVCYLSDDEIVRVCKLCEIAGATFVKTSTGFGTSGATVDSVALMKKSAPKLKVKAAGGVRSLEDVKGMIAVGADRIGTSAGVQIINGVTADDSY